MPEYLAPGVYVEEVEAGPKPIEGVSTSTAGFLGRTERGPTEPKFVTSFAEFQRIYGSYIDESYLAYAVDGFFRNGGRRCYVARVVELDALTNADKTADATLDDGSGTDVVGVEASGPGTWGHNVVLVTEPATLVSSGFKLTVRYYDDMSFASDPPAVAELEANEPTVEEVYDDLVTDESSSDYYVTRVNSRSTLVEVERLDGALPETGPTVTRLDDPTALAMPTETDYQGGSTDGERTGLNAFETIDDIQIVCAPDEVDVTGLTARLVAHCELPTLRDRVAVLQAGKNYTDTSPPSDAISDYAAFYYPWVELLDPVTNRPKQVPPGGHVAGIYARSDTQRGVHKAPANEPIRGVTGLQFNVTKADQERLNPRGVNCIRQFPGRGILVWGARTTSDDPLWRYLNVRRLFNYLEESIDEGTQWSVFEPNDEFLWARVRQSVSNFLTTAWRDGALMGTTPEEAFYVKCDRTTMTQDDVDNGRLIVEIGVAPTKPAEFVVFRIAQWTGGAES